jgi:hypothetical protein
MAESNIMTHFNIPLDLDNESPKKHSLSFFQTRLTKQKRLIIYGFTSRLRIFHLYGDVTTAGEGLQNLGLYSALRAFEQGGIFIVPHLL